MEIKNRFFDTIPSSYNIDRRLTSMKGTEFKHISNTYNVFELINKYNLSVTYDSSENSFFAKDNKEADIFDIILTVNGIYFDRYVDSLF